jgi:hypothetical protein
MAGYFGGKDRDPTGKIGQDKNQGAEKSTATDGKIGPSLSSGLSKSYAKAPGSAQAADKRFKAEGGSVESGRAVNTGNAGGAGTSALTGPKSNLPRGVTPMSQPAPMGATQYYGDPSFGQILGTVAPAFVPGGGILNNAPSIAKGKINPQNTGGLLGEGIDSLTGEKPGIQTGWSEDPSMTPGRDRAQRGTKRESFDQTTIGSTTGTDSDDSKATVPLPTDNFSDIQLLDRRKPGLKQMLESML